MAATFNAKEITAAIDFQIDYEMLRDPDYRRLRKVNRAVRDVKDIIEAMPTIMQVTCMTDSMIAEKANGDKDAEQALKDQRDLLSRLGTFASGHIAKYIESE